MKPSSSSTQSTLFTVPLEQGGERLDVFLSSQLPSFSRSQVQTLIKEGNVVPQFPVKAVKAGMRVLEGQAFQVTVPPSQKSDIPSQAISLDIVFEDDDLLVINKPAGLVVHPGAGNPDHTLINALVAHCPDIAGVGGVQRPGLVHRLDKDTSGLLVVAKTDTAYKSLTKQLRYRKLSREYLGIVKGKVEGRGTVDAPVGRHVSARKKMAVRPESGKKAVTHFRTLESNEKASLMHLKLETGRTHQIRVHLQYIHHPIWGDEVYGGPTVPANRQMLHAFRLSFQHPRTDVLKDFFDPPPQDFEECLSALDLQVPSWEKVEWRES
jgi:23S rRNA pseudouridine1911/1915/1917 synthase